MSFSPPPPAAGPLPGGQPGAGKPDNYLVWSILATLFCCLPFGIAGIVYAAQVDSKWNAGDTAGSIAAAANAKKWTMIAAIVGAVGAALWMVFAVALPLMVGSSS